MSSMRYAISGETDTTKAVGSGGNQPDDHFFVFKFAGWNEAPKYGAKSVPTEGIHTKPVLPHRLKPKSAESLRTKEHESFCRNERWVLSSEPSDFRCQPVRFAPCNSRIRDFLTRQLLPKFPYQRCSSMKKRYPHKRLRSQNRC